MPSGLNIRAVAERTGIPLHTLRAWERRYGVPRPARVPGNKYRVYDEQDVADVLWIKRQVESGVSPARASALLQQHERSMPVSTGAPIQPLAVRRQGLSDSLLAYDEQAAHQILDEAFALYSPEQVALQVIQPA
ncbi:MAG: MerR family transcriptional regulator, partial [Rudaea sp.]